nr:G protein-coupled receptor [Proales similis]
MNLLIKMIGGMLVIGWHLCGSCKIEKKLTEIGYEMTCANFDAFNQIVPNRSQLFVDEDTDMIIVSNLNFYPNRYLLLNNQFNFPDFIQAFSNFGFSTNFQDETTNRYTLITLIKLFCISGFEVDFEYLAMFRVYQRGTIYVSIELDFINFVPYLNGDRLIDNCDFNSSVQSTQLTTLNPLEFFWFKIKSNVKYFSNTCSIVFRNAQIDTLWLFGVGSSFIMSNELSFDTFRIDGQHAPLGSSINEVYIEGYMQRISSKLFDQQVFEKTQIVTIEGRINRIDECALFAFKDVTFSPSNPRSLFQSKQSWCQDYWSMNSTKRTIFRMSYSPANIVAQRNAYDFPEQDICIFATYPVSSHHFFIIEYDLQFECSCTIIWLIKNYETQVWSEDQSENTWLFSTNIYPRCTKTKNLSSWILDCDFKNRFANCGLNQIPRSDSEWTAFETTFLMAGLKYAFAVVLLPIVCVIGLVTSCLSIAVLRKMIAKLAEKRHDDTSKRSRLMYSYLLQHAVGSAAVCALFAFKPLTECVSYGGIYCSPVYTSWHTRLFDAIGLNLLGTALKLHTTLNATLFSLARLAINVKNKNRRSIRIFSKMRPTYVSLVCLLIAVLLNGFKPFTSSDYSAFLFDSDIFKSFFKPYFFSFLTEEVNSEQPFLFYLNLFTFMLTDIILPLLTMSFDICLLHLMRKNNRSKTSLIKTETKQKESNEKNMITMIILMGVFSLGMRIPETITFVFANFQIVRKYGSHFLFLSCDIHDFPLFSWCFNLFYACSALYFFYFPIEFILLVRFNSKFRSILREMLTRQTSLANLSQK